MSNPPTPDTGKRGVQPVGEVKPYPPPPVAPLLRSVPDYILKGTQMLPVPGPPNRLPAAMMPRPVWVFSAFVAFVIVVVVAASVMALR